MKRKKLILIGVAAAVACALGITACAQAANNVRKNPQEANRGTATYSETTLKAGSLLITTTWNGDTYYLPTTKVTSTGPTAVAFDSVNEIDDSNLWTVTVSDGQYKFKTSDNAYLYVSGNGNNNIRIDTGTTPSNAYWTVQNDGSLKCSANSRFLGIYNGADWRSYNSSTATNYKESATSLQFYEVSSGGEQDPVPATSVTINNPPTSLVAGEEINLSATVLPDDTTDELEWTSSNVDVAKVVSNKLVGVGAGSARITATAGEKSDYFDVTVTQKSLADYDGAVHGDNVNFYAYYTGKYNNATNGYFVADGTKAAYVYAAAPSGVSENDILHISGKISVYHGLREITNVTATKENSYQGLTAPVTLNLDEEALSNLAVYDQGRKATITGKVTNISANPSYGSSGTSPIYTIKVGDSSIGVQLHRTNLTEAEYNDFASKAEVNRTVTIEAYVSAYSKNEVTDIASITNDMYQLVNPKVTYVAAPDLTGISLNKSTLSLDETENETLSVSPVPAGAELDSSLIAWLSDDESVATVLNGKVTAVAEGTATVTAFVDEDSDGLLGQDEYYAECEVTVSASNYELKGYVNFDQDESTVINNQLSETNDPKITYSANDVDIIVRKNTGNSPNVWQHTYSSARWYANNKVTISSTKAFDKVKLTCDSGYQTLGSTAIAALEEDGITVEHENGRIILTLAEANTSIDLIPDQQIRPSYVAIYALKGSDNPNSYLKSAVTSATLCGSENIANPSEDTIVFSDLFSEDTTLSSSNPVEYANGTITALKAEAQYDPKYVKNDTALRFYAKNTLTIATTGASPICKVEFTCSTTNIDGVVPSEGSLSSGVWTGSANSVTFTNGNNSQVKIKSIKVICGTLSVSSVNIKFGATISKANWDAINDNPDWEITDYGFMFFRTSSPSKITSDKPVQDAIDGGKDPTVINKGDGVAPTAEEGFYTFTATINITKVANYNLIICAAPYITVKDLKTNVEKAYFLTETQKTVKDLAEDGDSDLTDAALALLISQATNQNN